jgi:hypothetical protein
MKHFTIKSEGGAGGSAGGGSPSILELIDETEGGFFVRIVHKHEDWEDVKEDFLSRELFETCLRTGYISELSA